MTAGQAWRELAGRGQGWRGQVWRFACVGLANTVLDLTVFALLHPHLGIVVANLISTSTGMVFSFLANGRFTFRAEGASARQALAFVAVTLTTMWVVTPLIIVTTAPVLGSVLLAKAGALVVTAGLNFTLYRQFVWRRPGVAARGRQAVR